MNHDKGTLERHYFLIRMVKKRIAVCARVRMCQNNGCVPFVKDFLRTCELWRDDTKTRGDYNFSSKVSIISPKFLE